MYLTVIMYNEFDFIPIFFNFFFLEKEVKTDLLDKKQFHFVIKQMHNIEVLYSV